MGRTLYFAWEVDLLVWIQTFVNGFTTLIAKILQICGEESFLIFVLGLLYWCIDKKLGRRISLAMAGSMVFGTLVKGLVLRRRPYMDHKQIKCIVPASRDADPMSVLEQGYSCASMHTAMATSTYGGIAESTKKTATIAIAVIMSFFTGISRLLLGVHYPTDVLAGWVIGVICIFGFGSIEKKHGYKTGFLVPLIIGLSGFFFCDDTRFYTSYGVTLGLFLGFMFEEKYVRFAYCKKWWTYVLRPAGGVLLFAIVSLLLKMFVQSFGWEETSTIALYFRFFRYTISTFMIIGIYPILFNRCNNKF